MSKSDESQTKSRQTKSQTKLEIVHWPDPVLARKTEKIEEITPDLVQLAKNMIELMYVVPGIGLAANQVGLSLRLAVIDTRKKISAKTFKTEGMTETEKTMPFPMILFNPELIHSDGDTIYEEGCLSVPGYFDSVKRAAKVKFRYTDEKGQLQEREVDGLTAICVQHEIDHLNGRLFLDRLTPIRRSMIKNKIKKNGYPEEYVHKSDL